MIWKIFVTVVAVCYALVMLTLILAPPARQAVQAPQADGGPNDRIEPVVPGTRASLREFRDTRGLVCGYKPDQEVAARAACLAAGFRIESHYRRGRLFTCRWDGKVTTAMITALARSPAIHLVEPNWQYQILDGPRVDILDGTVKGDSGSTAGRDKQEPEKARRRDVPIVLGYVRLVDGRGPTIWVVPMTKPPGPAGLGERFPAGPPIRIIDGATGKASSVTFIRRELAAGRHVLVGIYTRDGREDGEIDRIEIRGSRPPDKPGEGC
jgi:hypothetical protein